MKISRILLLVGAAFELLLAIPLLGGAFVLGTGYTALGFMFLFHLVTLVFAARERVAFYGPILGMVTSALAWIPILGWIMHLVSGIALLFNALSGQQREARGNEQRRFY